MACIATRHTHFAGETSRRWTSQDPSGQSSGSGSKIGIDVGLRIGAYLLPLSAALCTYTAPSAILELRQQKNSLPFNLLNLFSYQLIQKLWVG